MNNWKLRAQYQGDNDSDYIEVNGYLAPAYSSEPMMRVVPFGDIYAAPLRTAASETHGPVSNQVPGICNGTFTHTGSGEGVNQPATTITGEGSGAQFNYGFLADGTLDYIRASTGGSGYKVGDKLSITTTEGHGSQVIEFRLVDGSNATTLTFRLVHDREIPIPFPVHRAKCVETSPYYFHVYDYEHIQLAQPQNKLLDKYPDAAAAYGLRLLRSAYLGPAIRVSRSSDSAEKDIYFDSQGNLDTTALKAHVGASLGRVKTWYDQSGNGNDATQSATSQRPPITSASGALVTINGKPAINFDGTNDGFDIDASDLYGQARLDVYFHIQSDDTKYLMFSQGTAEGNHSFAVLDGSTSTSVASGYTNAGTNMYVNGVDMNYVSGTSTRDDIYTAFIENGAEHSNGAIIVHENAQTNNWTNFKVSAYSDYQLDGKMTEMVLYNTDQSANRENIEKDMALHSGAYQVEDAPLLDAYGGAHAAYSLRKLNSDYTGAAVRVRRNSDNTELDIGFKSDGTLDTDASDAFYDGSNLRIITWYDQSGNGKHMTQSSSGAQPLLYNDSGLMQLNGRPGARFIGNDEFTFDATGLDIGNLSSFVVARMNDTSGTQFVLRASGIANNKRFFAPLIQEGNFRFMHGVYHTDVGTTANTNNNLHTMIAGATQGDVEAFVNGTSVGTRTLSNTGIDTTITGIGGSGNLSNFMNGTIQEVVVYSSDQSERRLGIERNIKNHYEL